MVCNIYWIRDAHFSKLIIYGEEEEEGEGEGKEFGEECVLLYEENEILS